LIEFVVRARKAPTEASKFLGNAGKEAHVEYLTQILVNALFVSKGHRSDVCLTYVFEGSADFSRVLHFRGESLGQIEDQSEQGLLRLFARCLAAGAGLQKDTSIVTDQGIDVTATSFEKLIKGYQETRQVFLLEPKGQDIRHAELPDEAVFVLTDHIPMPPKQAKSMVRRGVTALSLGPIMLHASQCVVLIQNEYDRLG
jgi:tRNA (pseudouridine54-N1)-methyltransferase